MAASNEAQYIHLALGESAGALLHLVGLGCETARPEQVLEEREERV